ncbi:MAG: PP2C family protein-serine/threonine phosphatase [Streptosporangiaceae bacterium]
MVIIQAVLLLAAWLLLLLVAIQSVRPGRPRLVLSEEEQEALALQQALRLQSQQPTGDQRQQFSLPTQDELLREQARMGMQASYEADAASGQRNASNPGLSPLTREQASASQFGSIPFERAAQQQEQQAGWTSSPQPAGQPPRTGERREEVVPSNTGLLSEQEMARMLAAAEAAKAGEGRERASQSAPAQVALNEARPAPEELSERPEEAARASPLSRKAAPSALEQLAGRTTLPRLASLLSYSSRDPAPAGALRITLADSIPQVEGEWFDMVGWTIGHPGRVRARDPLEDFLLATSGLRTKRTPPSPFAVFALADGIAYEGPPRTTSRLVARAASEAALAILWRAERLDQDAIKQLMTESVQYANAVLQQWNQQHKASKIATLTLVLVLGTTAYIANVGDNRAYFYREGEGLVQITYDHSNVEPLLEQNKTTPEEVFGQPKEKQVYRVLGSQATVNVDVFALALEAGDLLILCSDGLWKVVRKAPFQQIVEQCVRPPVAAPQLVCPALLQAALAAGGGDHVSILAAQVQARAPEGAMSL